MKKSIIKADKKAMQKRLLRKVSLFAVGRNGEAVSCEGADFNYYNDGLTIGDGN